MFHYVEYAIWVVLGFFGLVFIGASRSGGSIGGVLLVIAIAVSILLGILGFGGKGGFDDGDEYIRPD